jgi:hypothetical protein
MVGFDQWKRCSFWFGGELIEKKSSFGLGQKLVCEQSVNPTGFCLPFINAVDMQT